MEQPSEPKRTGSRRIRRKFELAKKTEQRYANEDKRAEFEALTLVERKEAFLVAYEANRGLSFRACRDLGMRPGELADWMDEDAEFSERMNEVKQLGHERLRDHIIQRAMGLDGRKSSDLLAIFEAKAEMPELYQDKNQGVNVHFHDNRNMVNISLDDLRQGMRYLEDQPAMLELPEGQNGPGGDSEPGMDQG